jgi:hypothetical protein
VLHPAVGPDDAVLEAGAGTDLAAVTDDRRALQDRARVERDVPAELGDHVGEIELALGVVG